MALLIGRSFNEGDGHVRVTRGERYLLAGGGSDEHKWMQDVAAKFEDVTKGQEILTHTEVMAAIDKSGMLKPPPSVFKHI